MAARIDDLERVRRIREYNRQASARRRVKLAMDGRAQLLCWIPEAVRQRLDRVAAAQSQPLNDIVSELLLAALDRLVDRRDAADSVESPTACDSQPVEAIPVDRDQRILGLKNQGLNNSEIGRQLGCSESSVRRALRRLAAGVSA